jgi:hypothetical protein
MLSTLLALEAVAGPNVPLFSPVQVCVLQQAVG